MVCMQQWQNVVGKLCHAYSYLAALLKGKGQVLDITLLHDEHMLSSVAADWHELMIPQRIMRSSVARASEQLDPRCSMQTYHRPNQLH